MPIMEVLQIAFWLWIGYHVVVVLLATALICLAWVEAKTRLMVDTLRRAGRESR